jgi:DNA-binding NtrC family response regulator
VYLPIAPIAEEAPRLEQSPAQVAAGPIREALVFNVESTVERAVVSTIESLGMRALVSRTPVELLDVVRNGEREVQLVVIDVDRVGSEIRNIITAIRRARDRIKILCSTTDRVRWSKDLATIPGVEVVEKPLGMWTLTFHVRRALKSPLTGGLQRRVEVERDETQSPADPRQHGVRDELKDSPI